MAGEIKEPADKTAPCAAITEKQANRLGGCVGIFFQLFDWNRRFAKNKLFSRKSLLPGKQASKRFAGNEKMPKSKLNLIADENRGGFPNSKRSEALESKKHEMRSPGLVARLMGLESMPSIHRDKLKKKSSLSQINKSIQEDELLGKYNVFRSSKEEDLGSEKSRPQKIQKTTGVCDRRVVKKFGSEALQIKNVLTRVRKHNQYSHQHQKLASPVRSPRLHRKSSRLIDAAARILEPGLQAKKSAKCAIAYSNSRRCENAGNDPEVVSPDSFDFQHGYNLASCKNCGSLVDVLGSNHVTEEKGKNMAQVSELSSFCRKESNVSWGNREPSLFVAAKSMGSEWLTDANQVERKALHRDSHDFNGKHQKDEMVSTGFGNRNDFQNQVLQRERFPSEARPHPLQGKRSCSSAANAINHNAKAFAPMHRGSTSRNRPGVPSKIENSELNLQRNSRTRLEDSTKSGLSSPARKRRMASVRGQSQGANFVSPTSRKSDVDGTNACSSASERRESDFVPLKLCSPNNDNSRGCREAKQRKGIQHDSNLMGERYSRKSHQKRMLLDADTVGLLLQQKLKELASQQEDETGRGGASQSKSASIILQELVSSLALEQHVIRDADRRYAEKAYRSNGKTEMGSSLGYTHNSDYTSPGSVLDATFSNESCFSSSFDNSSGQIRLPLEPTEPDLDLLEDSATSIKKPTTSNFQEITNLINHVSHVLHGLSRMGLISTQSRFTKSRDVIIQTELFFGTQEDFLIHPKLLDELVIRAARSKNLVKLPGLTGGFLVDAMIEYLELRYYGYIISGFKQWRTLPLWVNSDGLIREVLEEVTKWTQMTGMYLEEIISIEIEKWQDFGTDASELGTEIAWEILCCLVGELAIDLCKCLPENHQR